MLADGRAQHPVGESVFQTPRRPVGAALQAVYIFTQHNNAVIGFHAARHHIGDDIDELALFQGAPEVSLLFGTFAVQFREVAAYAYITEIGDGPEFGTTAFFAALAIRVSLGDRKSTRLNSSH